MRKKSVNKKMFALTENLLLCSLYAFVFYSWLITGGHVDVSCGEIYSANSMVFNGDVKSRKLCTPVLDIRNTGTLRFHFGMGLPLFV